MFRLLTSRHTDRVLRAQGSTQRNMLTENLRGGKTTLLLASMGTSPATGGQTWTEQRGPWLPDPPHRLASPGGHRGSESGLPRAVRFLTGPTCPLCTGRRFFRGQPFVRKEYPSLRAPLKLPRDGGTTVRVSDFDEAPLLGGLCTFPPLWPQAAGSVECTTGTTNSHPAGFTGKLPPGRIYRETPTWQDLQRPLPPTPRWPKASPRTLLPPSQSHSLEMGLF